MNDVGNSNNTAIPGTSAWDQMTSPGKFYIFLNNYLLKMISQMQLNFFFVSVYSQNNNDASATVPTTPTKTTPNEPAPIFGSNEELHPDLVMQGWRKCWSKRENRHYFWNKQSGESLWEMPPSGKQ